MKLTKILEDIIIDMTSEASPLSSEEEKVVKHLKPALKKMQAQYGSEKGKQYFYGLIRNRAKSFKK